MSRYNGERWGDAAAELSVSEINAVRNKPERWFLRVVERNADGSAVCESFGRKPFQAFLDATRAAKIGGVEVGQMLQADIHKGKIVFAAALREEPVGAGREYLAHGDFAARRRAGEIKKGGKNGAKAEAA
jgi:hypothetical protein